MKRNEWLRDGNNNEESVCVCSYLISMKEDEFGWELKREYNMIVQGEDEI